LGAGRVPQVQQDVGRGQEEIYRGGHRVRRQDRLQGDIFVPIKFFGKQKPNINKTVILIVLVKSNESLCFLHGIRLKNLSSL
jgi:hypothetical protein